MFKDGGYYPQHLGFKAFPNTAQQWIPAPSLSSYTAASLWKHNHQFASISFLCLPLPPASPLCFIYLADMQPSRWQLRPSKGTCSWWLFAHLPVQSAGDECQHCFALTTFFCVFFLHSDETSPRLTGCLCKHQVSTASRGMFVPGEVTEFHHCIFLRSTLLRLFAWACKLGIQSVAQRHFIMYDCWLTHCLLLQSRSCELPGTRHPLKLLTI